MGQGWTQGAQSPVPITSFGDQEQGAMQPSPSLTHLFHLSTGAGWLRPAPGSPVPTRAPVTPAHGGGIGFLQPHPVRPHLRGDGGTGTGLPSSPTSGDRDGKPPG